MNRPLTGGAAVEAIGIYARLGARDARFDARRIAEDVRSRSGRLRIAACLRRVYAVVRSPIRPRAFRARRTVARAASRASSKSPGRPHGPAGREGRDG